MGSIYGRLGYNFDSTKFNGADTLSDGVINFLSNSSIYITQWQIDDIANNSASGYYRNPHEYTLASLAIYLDGITTFANTEVYTYTDAAEQANSLSAILTTMPASLINFTVHTNNLSGVTISTDASLYPDLNNALSVGRQILSLTNKSDSVQNNVPILGNFTSLYIGEDLNILDESIKNNYITLNNSFSGNTSNISNASMNVIISDVQTLKTFIDTRRSSDIAFYQNSLSISADYQTVLQFSNYGATQNSIASLIATDKLKNRLNI